MSRNTIVPAFQELDKLVRRTRRCPLEQRQVTLGKSSKIWKRVTFSPLTQCVSAPVVPR